MKREIVVIINGNVSELLSCWKPPQGIEVEVKEPEKSLETVFKGNNISEFYKLEGIIKKLELNHEIELISFFKAYDFSKEEIKVSELLSLSVSTTTGLEIEGSSPIRKFRCKKCGRIRFILDKINQLHIKSSLKSYKKPESNILSVGTIKLFHQDLIEKIRLNKSDKGLEIIPCLIRGYGDILIDEYYWVYSFVDLGPPAGDIEYSEICTECGKPEILINRSFLLTFNRGQWNGEDFCISNFLGPDLLFVSQRVFRLIDSLPINIKSNVLFQPIELL